MKNLPLYNGRVLRSYSKRRGLCRSKKIQNITLENTKLSDRATIGAMAMITSKIAVLTIV